MTKTTTAAIAASIMLSGCAALRPRAGAYPRTTMTAPRALKFDPPVANIVVNDGDEKLLSVSADGTAWQWGASPERVVAALLGNVHWLGAELQARDARIAQILAEHKAWLEQDRAAIAAALETKKKQGKRKP